jgi:hypothetical protein
LGEAEKFLQEAADIVPLSSLAGEFIEESRERTRSLSQTRGRTQTAGVGTRAKSGKAAQTKTRVAIVAAMVVSTAAIVAFWQRNLAIEGEIKALTVLSEINFTKNDWLGALVVSIKANQLLKTVVWVQKDVGFLTLVALQQASYKVQEYNRLEAMAAQLLL